MKRVTVAELNNRLKGDLKVGTFNEDKIIIIDNGGVQCVWFLRNPAGGNWLLSKVKLLEHPELKPIPGILLSLNARGFNANSKEKSHE